MNDKEVTPAVRLQAAQTILNNAGKFAERLRSDEKSTAIYAKDKYGFNWQ